ncbi:MAG: hypothetical protein K5893_01605 [Prevotella sp.]|nr:hypothetical protein [Prevotella sp.]
MSIAIYNLTSSLHQESLVEMSTNAFLSALNLDFEFCGDDFSTYGTHSLDLIFVRTGGTEGIFRNLMPSLVRPSNRPFYLLTSGKSNSLAAAMEILSFLQQNGYNGEIIHGSSAYVSKRIKLLSRVGEARRSLEGCRLGIIGEPSDWLISSLYDKNEVRDRLGIELVEIPMEELLQTIADSPVPEESNDLWKSAVCTSEQVRKSVPVAHQIYIALKKLVARHSLQGFTLRCFDLLTEVHNTGCLALAQLNADGIVAGCEGDVPAMLSMKLAQSLIGTSGFQANPAHINPDTGEILFAHCTIPFDLVERFEFDTHFESGIGVGVRGFAKEGPVTVLKVSGDLTRQFVEEGELIRCQSEPGLCRTQMVLKLSNTDYFLKHPIGNHHIILPGHHREAFEKMLKW